MALPLPIVDQPLPMPFPTRGLDVSRGYGKQAPGSAEVMTNVRVCDPSTYRLRGAARPGLVRYVPAIVPAGAHLIQELNEVVIADATALPSDMDDPGTTTINDPSSPGAPSSWGTGPLDFDPNTGLNDTGVTEGTRVPGYGGAPAQRRKGGSGKQPNKNKVGSSAPNGVSGAGGGGTAYCTTVNVTFKRHVGAPNTGGFDGLSTTFTCVVCEYWTTIDQAHFPTEVQRNKDRIAAKGPSYISIVNQKNADQTSILGLGNSSVTYEFLGAAVPFVPNSANACTFSTPNCCSDPNF